MVFNRKWTNAELSALKQTNDIDELVNLIPGRTKSAIQKKIKELANYNPDPWTDVELSVFPSNKLVNKKILLEITEKLPNRHRDQVWKKLKSMGYVWDKEYTEEQSDDNPYPDHGKPWRKEEMAHFPENKFVTKEILAQVQAALPRRKPSSIWPKMSKEGYIWQAEVAEAQETPQLPEISREENFVLDIAYELGFKSPQIGSRQPTLSPAIKRDPNKEAIADHFDLTDDYTSGDVYYALQKRVTPFPWEMSHSEEIAEAYKKRDSASIKEAAKVLHARLESYLNG